MASSPSSRQIFRTHRPFRAIIMDKDGTPVLWVSLCFVEHARHILTTWNLRSEDHPPGSIHACLSHTSRISTSIMRMDSLSLIRSLKYNNFGTYSGDDMTFSSGNTTPWLLKLVQAHQIGSFFLRIRDKPRRVLSLVDDPQPEPDLDQYTQFGRIDEGLWAWNFAFRDEQGDQLASVNRQFRGFGREVRSSAV